MVGDAVKHISSVARGWPSLSLVVMVDSRHQLDLKEVADFHHLPDSQMLLLNDHSLLDPKSLR